MPDPSRIALITAHGQPSDPQPPEAALARLSAQVQEFLPDWKIRSATLSAPGRLDAEMTEGAVVYPFFMARGWFAGQVLPKRLRGITHRMACPFGLDPALPALVAKAIIEETIQRGWADQNYDLLLAAHGSARGPNAAQAANDFASALRPLLSQAQISTGFIEQAPTIESAAHALGPRALCLPFFAQSGDHSRNDIPRALDSTAFNGQPMQVTGSLPGVAALIAQSITACAQADD